MTTSWAKQPEGEGHEAGFWVAIGRALRRRSAAPDPWREQLADALFPIMEHNHVASSELSTALIDAEYLERLSHGSADPQAREVVAELVGSLHRLKSLVVETRRVGQSCGELTQSSKG